MSDAAAATIDACANCGTPLAGAFCHACGQRHPTPRFTLRGLLGQVPQVLFNVDRSLFDTVRKLTLHPGQVIREYIDGRRVRYVNPLTLLTTLCGLSALGYALYPFDYGPIAAGVPAPYRDAYIGMFRMTFEYYTPLMTLLLPLAAAITRVVFRGRGRGYGEHLVANAYLFSIVNLISLAVLPLCIAGNGSHWFQLAWMLSTIPIFGYQVWATHDAFSVPERVVGDVVRALFAVLAFYTVEMAVMALFAIAYLVHARLQAG